LFVFVRPTKHEEAELAWAQAADAVDDIFADIAF